MKYLFTLLVLVFNGVAYISAKTENFIIQVNFDKCQGKYAGSNYTVVNTGTSVTGKCQDALKVDPVSRIISCGPKGEKQVSTTIRLAGSNFPNGATSNYKHISLVVSGPLQGMFLFNTQQCTSLDFLKKCSSVLGKGNNQMHEDIELMITDKLDLNVILSNNPIEASKKGANTICTGSKWAL